MANIQKLCDLKNPYQVTDESERLFVQGMKENITWHSENNKFFARLIESRNFNAEQLKSGEDCAAVPFVVANFFKAHEQLSVPKEKISVHLTSSGTTGQKSQIFFDDWSLGAPQRMIDFIFEENGWISKEPANYLLYSYETASDSKLGTAYTDNFLCKYAPIHSVFCALRLTGGGGHECIWLHAKISRMVKGRQAGPHFWISGIFALHTAAYAGAEDGSAKALAPVPRISRRRLERSRR
jgi:hypothetical protein